jgi:hypothetical protein
LIGQFTSNSSAEEELGTNRGVESYMSVANILLKDQIILVVINTINIILYFPPINIQQKCIIGRIIHTFTPDGVHELAFVDVFGQNVGHLVISVRTHSLVQLQCLCVEAVTARYITSTTITKFNQQQQNNTTSLCRYLILEQTVNSSAIF